ncbi:Lck-interacting transmembrane adapter 1 [Saguinus oedipus]|uniref:Lck-interacting transmembrane adapter 1 n=1 Tax=Saguinus oedipus TaxID=9490 RepID=A0ABQ9VLW4_SAGOE|nr:Lck-interacting transmembrane adapter 1 [Saguinus oedipus]
MLRPAPLAVGPVHSLPQVCPSARCCLGLAAAAIRCPAREGAGGRFHTQFCTRPRTGLGPEADDPAPHPPPLPPRPEDALAPRKRAQAKLQGSAMPAEASLLRRTHLCSLSKSDTRLHELHRGPLSCRGEWSAGRGRPGLATHCCLPRVNSALTPPPALRPASVDLLRPHWLEVSRDISGSQGAPSAFPHRERPQALSAAAASAACVGPEATYSNVGLAAFPGVSLAASPVVTFEYARVQKRQGTHRSPQEPKQGKAEVTPATQVEVLYSRVCKPKRREPGPTTDPLDPKGQGVILALASDPAYQSPPLRAPDVDSGHLENVYESIREPGDPAGSSGKS